MNVIVRRKLLLFYYIDYEEKMRVVDFQILSSNHRDVIFIAINQWLLFYEKMFNSI